ncbi:MAG: NrdJb [Cycloclasticus sp. symbiont of Poecilosclerida sp. N]|nr:MAG: NrdJb [Cycloclasticus sp. symbiont of Poecilosclerida sp. N]
MTQKISQNITGYEVVKKETESAEGIVGSADELKKSNIIQMHESLARPDMLLGSTYKIKTPLSDHSLYITINDLLLNEGTDHEQRRPFEVFINSKNMDHFQWIVALTRIMSAVFRKGGDITFLVEELRSVFDPSGGYFKKGGRFMPSLVAEIGDVVESHLKMIGLIKTEEISEHKQKIMDEKRAQFEANKKASGAEESGSSTFPEGSKLCGKCSTKAMIKMDGCLTCLNCGDSKCS